eukprot:TRINITY_DN44631_c0_g1_i1.p2 TRINITY_DN44631_c0_g1~~TRINITY_DN44631_c0_g1_i1.p2  ORF type:complete len:216 (-),score=29.19 TRINITY_DN44631_c0_g1_i1:323-970(-)
MRVATTFLCVFAALALNTPPQWPTTWTTTRMMYVVGERTLRSYGTILYDWTQQAMLIRNQGCSTGNSSYACDVIESEAGTFALGEGIAGKCCYMGPWGAVPPNYMENNKTITHVGQELIEGVMCDAYSNGNDKYYQVAAGVSVTGCPWCRPGVPFADDGSSTPPHRDVFLNPQVLQRPLPSGTFAIPAGCRDRACPSAGEGLGEVPPSKWARRLA